MSSSLLFVVWAGRCIGQWSYCSTRHLLSVLWYAWSFFQVHCAPKSLNTGYSRHNLSLIYYYCELNHMRLRACQCDMEQPAYWTWQHLNQQHIRTQLYTASHTFSPLLQPPGGQLCPAKACWPKSFLVYKNMYQVSSTHIQKATRKDVRCSR